MSIPISGSDDDAYFEKNVEGEWQTCVSYLNWLQKYVVEGNLKYSRYETMKKYWEYRLKALVPVIYKEKVGWLKDLEAKYPSGVDWRDSLDEVLKM